MAKFSELSDFLMFVKKHFIRDRCVRTASSLSYTALLSLVPLMAVMFSTLAAFPIFQDIDRDIEAFVFDNFVPALGETVRQYLHDFSEKASGLRNIGLLFLFVTVLSMMSTIETAFNTIWRVRAKRKPIVRFLIYWAILTLGPLLVGTGFIATSYLVSLPLFNQVDSTIGLKTKLLTITPFLTTTLAFFLLYRLIPNRVVSMRSALIGSVVAGLLFEIAKRAFAYYVVNFPGQQAIYGTFATIPIFLIWVYLSWLVVLLGAEITRCHMIYHRYVRRFDEAKHSIFIDAFRITGHLWQGQTAGDPVTVSELLLQEPDLDDERLYAVIGALRDAGWLQRTEDGGWIILRDLGTETLLSLYLILPGGLPLADEEPLRTDTWNQRLDVELGKAFSSLKTSMDTSLKSLYGSD